jgi:hypothetical protein
MHAEMGLLSAKLQALLLPLLLALLLVFMHNLHCHMQTYKLLRSAWPV